MKHSFPRARQAQRRRLRSGEKKLISVGVWWSAIGLSLLLFCSCARLPRHSIVSNGPANNPPEVTTQTDRININAASAAELEALPGVGKVLAERIVAHRERYGAFRRAEHLMMVHGFSDNKFRMVRNLVSVG